jgi:translocation and assembly module TamA
VTVRQITPDFWRPEQNLIWIAEYGQEKTKGFNESHGSFSGLIERKLNKKTLISYGGVYKALRSERSDNNGLFNLLKVPLQLRWSNANNILDPTKGMSFQVKVTPTLQASSTVFSYCINTFTGIWYHALKCDDSLVLANKIMLGSILGKSRYEIPPPERFYAGSDNTIRGYHFMTVSPLNKKNDPIGGRSMVIFATELRYRFSENFGCVIFYDIGNVYSSYLPEIAHKQLQAVGAGIRYYTPIGPLRLDIALPLNRRRGLDSLCQVYFSIGQSF